MDFFGHQDLARRRTALLVGLYALAVIGIILALYAVVAVLFATTDLAEGQSLWRLETLIWVTLGVLAVVLSGSLFKTAQLSQGGSAVARALGGRLLAPNTTDGDERRLLNIVEEMALAAGVAVPQVYLLDHEPGINAFAAGFSPRDAVIGVTRGGVQQLSRAELQGVVAHEFSHIVNGDMRLNIRLMGVLFGILMITVIGHILLRTAFFSGRGGRSRGNDKRGGNPLPILGLAMILIGYIGVFFANLIKSAVSRQREYFSDASAVQYTRNPSGIAGALKKIGAHSTGAKVANVHASEASHMFFGSTLGRGFSGLFATHPPLQERIARLDPAANPHIAMLAAGSAADAARGPVVGAAGISGFAAGAAASAGTVDLAAAHAVIGQLPETLRAAVHDPLQARALVYVLLRSERPQALARQQEAVQTLDPAAEPLLEALAPGVQALSPMVRLPLTEMAIPALKALPLPEYRLFRKTMRKLIEADEQVSLFEYALQHMIVRHVEPAFGKVSSAPVRYRKLEQVLPACRSVLASLAAWGTTRSEEAAACYAAGMKTLHGQAETYDPSAASLHDVDRALDLLAEASAPLKRRLLDACTSCVLSDGRVAPAQAELLRAVADAMDVPFPPIGLSSAPSAHP